MQYHYLQKKYGFSGVMHKSILIPSAFIREIMVSLQKRNNMRLKTFKYLLLLVSLMMSLQASADVEVNATNFPDEAFLNWVLNNVAGTSDGVLTDAEIAEVTSIDCSGTERKEGSIESLQGIEFFTALTSLRCSYNKLTYLDVSQNTALTSLDCSCNYYSMCSLDVSKNTELSELYCHTNWLTSLDVSNNGALTYLDCSSNQLTSLYVRYNEALTYLDCSFNQLASLDVRYSQNLIYLDCNNNYLLSLDVSYNAKLTYLDCSTNGLATLDVSTCYSLKDLRCYSNQLISLNVGDFIPIESLYCYDNSLTSLYVGTGTLTALECSYNHLLYHNISSSNSDISYQTLSLTAVTIGEGVAIPVPIDFDFTKVSNLKLDGTNVAGSITSVGDQNYLVFAQAGTAANAIDGKYLTYTYSNILGINNQYVTSSLKVEVTLSYTPTTPTGIEVNATNFPDEAFRNWVLQNVSGASDGILTDEEIAKVTNINCSGTYDNRGNITSFQGIEYFTALTELCCSYNQLTILDISKNTALTSLECFGNKLAALDVSKNTALKDLSCDNNQLASLDVSKNTALEEFSCGSNQLTKLDVSNNTALTNLYCSYNLLTSLSVSNYMPLRELRCSSNQLTTLSVSAKSLYILDCSSNQLTTLDVSYISSLQRLNCSSNQLTTLDASKHTALASLECADNQLASLDLSKNSSINFASIGRQSKSLKAVSTSAGIAIPVPSDFDFTKVSNLKLDGASVSGSLTTVDGQKYLVFAQTGTAQSAIDGKQLTYDYNTGNSYSDAASMDVTVSLSYTATTPTGIEVNATNFPDEAFRNWVLQNVSGASDGFLTDEEIANVTNIICNSKNITSLQGVEFFTALVYLNCESNLLASLDVSKNTALTTLSCYSNQLTSLDVSQNTALEELYCPSNQLTSLDVSKNMALTNLSCSTNQLTSLDVSKNTALKTLYCSSNQLPYLDVSKNIALEILYCESNQLTGLDVSKNTALIKLSCSSNQLTTLDVSMNTVLKELSCSYNQLTSLDVSKNTVLKELYCSSNQLTSLDISKNTVLNVLDCSSNRLTTLDVRQSKRFSVLSCGYNLLTNLDLSTIIYGFGKVYIGPQNLSLKAKNVGTGIAIPVPSDFNFSKVSNLKLAGTIVNGSITTVDGQKYLVFAQPSTVQTAIDGKELTYTYYTDNSWEDEPLFLLVTVTLSYTPTTYSLSIQSGAGGSVSYDGTTITNKTQSFTVNEGTSATITISPNSGYRLSRLTANGTNVTSNVSNNKYTINSITANTTVVATFEQIPATTYSLSIQSGAGGSVSYDGTTVTNTTRSFTVNEGTSATITISPNSGYRLSKLTVNGTNVTSSVSNNKYTINSITANTTVFATFEQIPATTYSLSIQSGAGGSVSYDGTTVTNTTRSFTVAEGASATITITPNTGYKLSKLTVNGTNVTSSVKDNKYTISSISGNTTVVATFEQITYSLSVQATGNGTVTFNSTATKNKTNSFTVNHGSSATLSISPDNGYRLASLKVNGTNVTSSVSNNQYTISSITANTTVVATFEQIPATTYSLSIQSGAGGSVFYDGTTITNKTQSFTIAEGSSATITVSPNSGYKLASLVVNGTDVTSGVENNQYTISNITANTTVVVTYKAIPQTISVDGINYEVKSATDYTLNVGKGNYSGHVVIPATVSYDGNTWTVAGVVDGAFNLSAITAITWNPNTAIGDEAFGAQTNPNLLLYVKSEAYAPTNVQNVIANGLAKKIVLTDAASGNDFNCPEAFTAEEISYTHRYGMTTGIGECRGWETIALPFTVQKVMHQTKGQLVTFKQWDQSTSAKPYWLYKLTYTGFAEADFIEANTPYVISMPNHEKYFVDYILAGNVIFSAENATVKTSENLTMPTCNDKTFRPCFAKTAQSGVYAINAVNSWVTNTGGYKEGSVFVEGLRPVLPFEAYMTTNAANAKGIIPIFETQPTAIREIPMQGEKGVRIYTLSGQLVIASDDITVEEALKHLSRGVYIVNGMKQIIK